MHFTATGDAAIAQACIVPAELDRTALSAMATLGTVCGVSKILEVVDGLTAEQHAGVTDSIRQIACETIPVPS